MQTNPQSTKPRIRTHDMKTDTKTPLNQGKFAIRMRRKRAARMAQGLPANKKRLQDDALSPQFIARMNEHLKGQSHAN